MKKSKLQALFSKIEKAVGEKYCWFDDYSDNAKKEAGIQVGEWAEDDARKIIEDAGYIIISCDSFCGSDYDGVTFVIKEQ